MKPPLSTKTPLCLALDYVARRYLQLEARSPHTLPALLREVLLIDEEGQPITAEFVLRALCEVDAPLPQYIRNAPARYLNFREPRSYSEWAELLLDALNRLDWRQRAALGSGLINADRR